MKTISAFLVLISFVIFLSTCRKDKGMPDYAGYPEEVGKIIINKCAVSGCHNTISKDGAAGLDLTTWEKLFEGSRGGNAAVIPFRPDQSFLLYAVNTFSDMGPQLFPTMPVNKDPLSREEVVAISDWISSGAPDKNGYVKFSDHPLEEKLFIINQGCDMVHIADAESGLIMRSVDVGASPAIESPHYIHLSHDGIYFYVCFYSGDMFQKFRTLDGSFVGQVNIGSGLWNTFTLTENDSLAFVIDWEASGKIAVVDIRNMQLLITYQGSGLLEYPHGSAVKDNWLYITAQSGNFIYKIDITDIYNPDFNQIVLQPGEIPSSAPKYDPHQIHFSPDDSEYNISCQRSNEVRFFNASNDSLIAIVPTGKYPQHPHYSMTTDYLFVTCMEDDITYPGKTGSVSVINYKTHTFVKSIYTGFQPHGQAIDDNGKKVFIANRNINPSGPAPHHSSSCNGRNGYLTIIDMNTLELVPGYNAEMSVDPYYIAGKEHH